MFKSLLGTQQGRRSERTPLLAALDRYRNRNDDSASEGEGEGEDNRRDDIDGENYDEDDDDDAQRDGPLLPVFSAEVLGTQSHANCEMSTPLTLSLRSTAHLQHHPCDSDISHPAMRDDPLVGPAALPPSQPVPSEADPATDPLESLLAGHLVLPCCKCTTVSQRGGDEPWEYRREQDESADMRAIGYEVT
jgi:hypothetical protein